MLQNRLVPFFFMLVVYTLTMGLYYNQTHSIIINETEKNLEDILLSQRALSYLVSDIQKPEIYKLKADGTLHKDYFSPALLSSSYITIKLNEFANKEREKLGVAPLIYKYASPNPTNPENLADVYDMSIYEKFKNKQITKYKETVIEDDKQYLYYAVAGKTIGPDCLHCHGDPKDAPQALIDKYGSENGFGYKVGELSSVISIKAPLDGIYKENDIKFLIIALIVLTLFIILFVLTGIIQARLDKKEKEVQEARQKQEKSKQKTKALESSIESLYDHVISLQFDLEGNIIQVSDALCRLSGYTKDELIGNSFYFFNHPDTSENQLQEMWKTFQKGEFWAGEVKKLTKEGKVFWVEARISPMKDEHNITYAFESIMRTITDRKALLEDVNIDPLTCLLNRKSFKKSFTSEKDRSRRDKKYLALIMIDIDFFKQYNDYYGHQKGDEVLQRVALNLQKSFRRSSDFIFRLGGEEFAVITSERTVSQIIDSANNACHQMRKEHIEHVKSDVDPFLTISIGVAIITHDSNHSFTKIYKESDKVLHKAKEKGRNRVEYVEL